MTIDSEVLERWLAQLPFGDEQSEIVLPSAVTDTPRVLRQNPNQQAVRIPA